MKYFIYSVKTYSPPNKKSSAICSFVQEYQGTLISDYKSLVYFTSEVTKEIHRLNDLYRKSMPLTIRLSHKSGYLIVYYGNDSDKVVCYIYWQEVRQTLSYTINQSTKIITI